MLDSGVDLKKATFQPDADVMTLDELLDYVRSERKLAENNLEVLISFVFRVGESPNLSLCAYGQADEQANGRKDEQKSRRADEWKSRDAAIIVIHLCMYISKLRTYVRILQGVPTLAATATSE